MKRWTGCYSDSWKGVGSPTRPTSHAVPAPDGPRRIDYEEVLFVRKPLKECEESPDGKHSFTPDFEYDSSGETINCEHCGQSREEAKLSNNSEKAPTQP